MTTKARARRMIYAKLNENQLLLTCRARLPRNIKAAADRRRQVRGLDERLLGNPQRRSIRRPVARGKTLRRRCRHSRPKSYRRRGALIAASIGATARHSRCCGSLKATARRSSGTAASSHFVRGDIVLFMEWFGQGRQPNTGLRLCTPQLRDGIIEREIDAGLRCQDP